MISLFFTTEQAAKSKKPIDASVALIDGRSISLNLDSASTSAEVCQAVTDKINLRDTYGFSLFITLNNKVRFSSSQLNTTPQSFYTFTFYEWIWDPNAVSASQPQLITMEFFPSHRLQTWSLGSSGRHVLDAVAQCEQEERSQDRKEWDAPWRLSIRKELFTPWHDCSVDPISTDLIYKQIIKGIKSEEYTWEKVRVWVLQTFLKYKAQ